MLSNVYKHAITFIQNDYIISCDKVLISSSLKQNYIWVINNFCLRCNFSEKQA